MSTAVRSVIRGSIRGLMSSVFGTVASVVEEVAALDLNFLTATIDSSGAPDADSGTTQLTYTNRTSHAMQYNSDGVLEYGPHNLCCNSEDLDTLWGNTNATLAKDATDPDGGTTAYTMTDDGTAGYHYINQPNLAMTTDTTWTFWAKAGTLDYVAMSLAGFTNSAANCIFVNLSAGTIVSTGSRFDSSSIEDVGNGWYKVTCSRETYGSNYDNMCFQMSTDGTIAGCNYTGSGDTVLLWRPYVRNTNSPDTYIETTNAAKYGARISHKPVTNLLSYPEQFDNAAWTNTRSSETSGQTDPFSGTNAFKLVEDGTASSTHFIQQANSVTYVSGKTYTFSCYAKADERTFVELEFGTEQFPTSSHAFFNLSTGAVGTEGAGVASSGIAAVTGATGWYRCWITATADASGSTTDANVYLCDADNSNSFTGDSSSGAVLFGAQVNEGGIEDYIGCTNLLDDDQDFTSTWVNTNTDEPTTNNVAPDGTSTADEVAATSTADQAFGIYQSLTGLTAANSSNLSFFLKPGTRASGDDFVQIAFDSDGSGADGFFCNFNLTNGSAGTVTAMTAGTATSAAITLDANGYYRCSIAGSIASGTVGRATISIVDNISAAKFEAGNLSDNDSVIAWGAQLTVGSATLFPYVGAPQTGYTRAGYIAEPAATNLITESNDLSTDWGTTTTNCAQLGTRVSTEIGWDADVVEVGASGGSITRGYYIGITSTADQHVLSSIVGDEAGGTGWVALSTYDTTDGLRHTYFDIRSGALGTLSAGHDDYNMEPLGNGLYRISVVNTYGGTTTQRGYVLAAASDLDRGIDITTYPQGTKWFRHIHSQLELGTYPSSHFPTTGGSATRAADLLEETGFSYYNATEGTLIYEGSPVQPVTAATDRVTFNNDTANEVLKITDDASANTDFDVTDGGVSQASIDSGENAVNGVRRIVAAGYKANDFGASIDGATAVTDVSGTVPTPTQLVFGDGYHRSFKYWDDNSALATRSLSTDDGTAWRDNR